MTRVPDVVWPHISDPKQREILHILWNRHHAIIDVDFLDRLDYFENSHCMVGLNDLWGKIQSSKLADRFLSSPESLLVIAPHLGQGDQRILKQHPPSSTTQYIDLVIDNLEWYIDPDSSRTYGYSRIRNPGRVLFAVLACVFLIVISITSPKYEPMMWWFLIPVCILILAVHPQHVDTSERQYDKLGKNWFGLNVRARPQTRATVLFHYLLREYSDTEAG